jgi:hypothetical protein
MDLRSDRTDIIDKVFWQRFVDTILEVLDYETPLSAKEIEKILIYKKWGLPKKSFINKAINTDLKDKVVKIGKSKWIKKAP